MEASLELFEAAAALLPTSAEFSTSLGAAYLHTKQMDLALTVGPRCVLRGGVSARAARARDMCALRTAQWCVGGGRCAPL